MTQWLHQYADGKSEWLPYRTNAEKRMGIAYANPLVSKAMGCHPLDVGDFNRKSSSGIEYRDNGDCLCDSRAARRSEMKSRGLNDMDGGYGDG